MDDIIKKIIITLMCIPFIALGVFLLGFSNITANLSGAEEVAAKIMIGCIFFGPPGVLLTVAYVPKSFWNKLFKREEGSCAEEWHIEDNDGSETNVEQKSYIVTEVVRDKAQEHSVSRFCKVCGGLVTENETECRFCGEKI